MMMTCMRDRRVSKFDQIRPLTAVLAALSVWKTPHLLIMGKTVLPSLSTFLDQIILILAGNDDTHKSLDEFEIQPYPLTRDNRVSCP